MYFAFIVNPVAGTGFALTTMEKLEAALAASSVEYRIFRTERPGHATQIAAELAGQDQVYAVVAVGGDGTVNEVIEGIIGSGSRTPLAILSSGTVNDFCSSVGLPKDAEKFCAMLRDFKAVPIDVGVKYRVMHCVLSVLLVPKHRHRYTVEGVSTFDDQFLKAFVIHHSTLMM